MADPLVGKLCPECIQGKHRNCDGVADIDDNNNPVRCRCNESTHPGVEALERMKKKIEAGVICSGCRLMNHEECNGVNDRDLSNVSPCRCETTGHRNQRTINDATGNPLWVSAFGYMVPAASVLARMNPAGGIIQPYFDGVILNKGPFADGDVCPSCREGIHDQCYERKTIQGTGEWFFCKCEDGEHPNRQFKPANNPGVLTEAFPELAPDGEDWMANYRMRPDSEIIKDLHDVEIMTPSGEWVPAVPLPIHRWFGIKQCHCGKRRIGTKSYQEHYAYAHILGMEDL